MNRNPCEDLLAAQAGIEPACMYCGATEGHSELIFTGDCESRDGFEVWFCCHACRDAGQACETFHRIPLEPLPTPPPEAPPELFQRVTSALKSVRLQQAGLGEFQIHDALCQALAQAGIAHRREHTFGPRCRADIWVQGIGVEVKKQRPSRASLLSQVQRYADQPSLSGLIVVLEKSIHLPKTINSKPVAVLSLNSLWGIAL